MNLVSENLMLLITIFSVNVNDVIGQYEVPDALVEVFQPRGLRVSIPHEEGVKLFAFHGRINQEILREDGGQFSADVLKPKNGRWTFYDSQAKFKIGDVLNYWTYVDYFDGTRKLGYTKDDQFVVQELVNRNNFNHNTQKPTICLTTVADEKKCAGEEIFKDDFDNLKNDVWTAEKKFASGPDYEFVWYGNNRKVLEVKNGFLKIQPIPTDELHGDGFVFKKQEVDIGHECTGVRGSTDCVQTPASFFILPPVTSAMITTRNRFSFKYGKIEIRAKLPRGDWIYPEFFLIPKNEHYGPGYASGQIRIAFTAGNSDWSLLQGGLILGESQAARNYAMKTTQIFDEAWRDQYHKFTLLWRPDQLTVSVDDTIYGQIFPPGGGFADEAQHLGINPITANRWRTGSTLAPFDQEMYLAIGVGVGGFCFGDREDGSKPWRNYEAKSLQKFYNATNKWRSTWTHKSALEVEYVKVWAL